MDEFRDLLSWAGVNWTALVTLFFSGVVAWATVVNARVSSRLADAELHPAISVYLELDRVHRWFFELVVKNSGRGIARNVRFEINPDIPIETKDPDSRLTRLSFIRGGLSQMGSGQELRSALNSYPAMVKTPIEVTVSYERDGASMGRKRIESRFVLDVREFGSIARIGEDPTAEIARSMKQLAGDVRSIKQGGSFANLTVTVKRRYFTSAWVNRQARRWFGTPTSNPNESALACLRKEVGRSLRQWWRATHPR